MKQQFRVSALARPPQKFLYGFLAFSLAYALSCLVADIWRHVPDLEMSLLILFLCVLIPFIVLCGFLCLFGYNGVEVDLETGTWRNFTGLLGLKYGKPESVPSQLDYILVFESVRPHAFEMEMGTYEVAVIYNGDRKQLFVESRSRRHAVTVSARLAELFRLEVLDKTTDK